MTAESRLRRQQRAIPDTALADERSRSPQTFLLGCMTFLHVDWLGQIFVVELVLAAAAIFALLRGRLWLRTTQDSRLLVKMLALWLVSAIVSDWMNASPAVSAIKGAALVAVTGLDVLGLLVIMRGQLARMRAFYWGVVVSGFLGFLLQPSTFARSMPWKFGFAYSVALMLILILGRYRGARPTRVWFTAIPFAGLAFILGTRSLSLIFLVALVLALAVASRGRQSSSWRVVRGAVGATLASAAAYATYSWAALAGLLGDAARSKFLAQTSGQFGVLLGGRPELAFTWAAIRENPLAGHGSYALASINSISVAASELQGMGYSLPASDLSDLRAIPAHSCILQAWAWHGVAAVPFWLLLGVLLVRAVLASSALAWPTRVLVSFVSCLALWDLLFSPFGADRRLQMAGAAVLACITLSDHSKLSRRAERIPRGAQNSARIPQAS